VSSLGPERATLLAFDDEPGIVHVYNRYLSTRPPPAMSSRTTGTLELGAERPDYRLLLAHSGERALELVRSELDAGRAVHGAFCDLVMPGGIDGLETIRQLRQIDSRMLFTIATAHACYPLDRLRSLFVPEAVDAWGYLSKPFTPEEIRQRAQWMVDAWTRRRELEHDRHDSELRMQRLERQLRGQLGEGS
jgi:CheY-like chemotaxis protein